MCIRDSRGRDCREKRRHHRRRDQPTERDGLPLQPAVRAQRRLTARAAGKGRRPRAQLRRRDHQWRLRNQEGDKTVSGNTTVFLAELTVLILAIFLGIEVISKVPTLLHTPLMSGTNAIHGIVVVGAILITGTNLHSTLAQIVGFFAMVLASANVVGGFAVTDRMLEMFKGK